MKVSIMQPTFLPWVGYFYMISKSDLFVFLDDVQFERRSFQSRNKLLIGNSAKIISVPVRSKNKYDQLLSKVDINYEKDWVNNHLKTIYYNYCNHNFYNDFFPIIEKIFQLKETKLIDLNFKLISAICNYLDIKTKFNFSSEFNIKKKKSEKILEILKITGASSYLTPEITKNYLGSEGQIIKKENIEVNFLNYNCREYSQRKSKKFVSHLSIIDLIFNLGKDAKRLI